MPRSCMRLPRSLCSYLQTNQTSGYTDLASSIDMKRCATSCIKGKSCPSSQPICIVVCKQPVQKFSYLHSTSHFSRLSSWLGEYFTSTRCLHLGVRGALAGRLHSDQLQYLSLLTANRWLCSFSTCLQLDLALLLTELLQLVAHLHELRRQDSTFHNSMVALQLVKQSGILAADHHRINPE